MVTAFEPVNDCVKVSLICEARDSSLQKVMFLSSLLCFASIVNWCCLTDESASAFNSIQDGEEGLPKASDHTSFFPVTSTNVEFSPQNFLTLSFNPFAMPV